MTVSWCLWFRLQKTVESPQLQSIMVVDVSCRGAESDSHCLAVQQTIIIPVLQFLDKVIDGPVFRVVLGFPRSFTCPLCATKGALLRSAAAVHQQGCPHPVVAQSLIPMAWQTIEIPLLPYGDAGSLDSQVFCHLKSLQAAMWHGQTRHTSTTSAPPPPPPPPHHHHH